MAKTEREKKAIEKFCEHMEKGFKALGFETTFFDYNNLKETITIGLSYGKRVVVNVNMSSTKMVALDVFNQLGPHLKDDIL